MENSEWILCPICSNKTEIEKRNDTELKKFPLQLCDEYNWKCLCPFFKAVNIPTIVRKYELPKQVEIGNIKKLETCLKRNSTLDKDMDFLKK